MFPGQVTWQCHVCVPSTPGERGRSGPRPHSPVEGGAGAVVDHLPVALHLQVGIAVVAAVVLELVDGLRGTEASARGRGRRVGARPGPGRPQGLAEGGESRTGPAGAREACAGGREGEGPSGQGSARRPREARAGR